MPVVRFCRQPAASPLTAWRTLARHLELPLLIDGAGRLRLMAPAGGVRFAPQPAGRYRRLLRTVPRHDPFLEGGCAVRLTGAAAALPQARQLAAWFDGRVSSAGPLAFPLHYCLPRPIGGFAAAGALGSRAVLTVWLAAIRAAGYLPVGVLPSDSESPVRRRLIAVA